MRWESADAMAMGSALLHRGEVSGFADAFRARCSGITKTSPSDYVAKHVARATVSPTMSQATVSPTMSQSDCVAAATAATAAGGGSSRKWSW